MDGGDVLQVGKHFSIGVSKRTNQEGAENFIEIVRKYGYDGTPTVVENTLHLKTSMTYLENGIIITSQPFANKDFLKDFDVIVAEEGEEYFANCLWINGKVLVSRGFPKTLKKLE